MGVFLCSVNDLMESKGGKDDSSSSSSKSLFTPLDYGIEDVRPKGGIKKFRSAAYSNVSSFCMLFIFMSKIQINLCLLLIMLSLCLFCSALANHPDIPRAPPARPREVV